MDVILCKLPYLGLGAKTNAVSFIIIINSWYPNLSQSHKAKIKSLSAYFPEVLQVVVLGLFKKKYVYVDKIDTLSEQHK